jgi:hypothetical protein
MLPTKFRFIWTSGFRGEDFFKSAYQKPELPVAAFQGCFLPSFDSFVLAVSEEKIFFRNQPIRNKNGLWWPCLLTDRDEMSNLYREPSIDASYQVSVHLTKQFQKRRFLKISQSETRIACGSHVC